MSPELRVYEASETEGGQRRRQAKATGGRLSLASSHVHEAGAEEALAHP